MDNKRDPPPQYEYAPPVKAGRGTPVYPVLASNVPRAPINFGPNSQVVTCPSCHTQISTRVKAETYMMTHVVAVLLLLVWCCCLPYLFESCKKKNHYCPSCGAYLGSYDN